MKYARTLIKSYISAILLILILVIPMGIQRNRAEENYIKIESYSSRYVTYFISTDRRIATIEVYAYNTSDIPISKYPFGIFLEHHGFPTGEGTIYHGIWAELLDNPEFESSEYFGTRIKGEKIAYAWRICGEGTANFSLVEGYGVGRAQRIEVTVLNSSKLGICQYVYLPIHRINVYTVTLWIRGNTKNVSVSLEKRDGTVLAECDIHEIEEMWKRFTFNLTVPKDAVRPGQEVVFVIALKTPGWIEVDHASLMPADNIYGFDPDVIKFLRQAGITLIRWPGGNFASQYHWKDGIGPVEYRPVRLNAAWNIPEYNRVGTDEFLKFCELVGAEPLIVINAGWNGTVKEAAEWVEYLNGDINTTYGKLRAEYGHPEPYNVTFWELGNELYGSWQIGHMTAMQYAIRYSQLYEAMKSIDPNINFIANGGLDQVALGHDSWLQWDGPLLERNQGKVQYLSRHYLIWVDQSETDYYRAIAYTFALRPRWKEVYEILKKYQDPPPKLAITEVQGAKDLDVSETMIEAMFTAGLYNSAIYSDGFVDIITRSSLMWFGGGLRKRYEIVYPTPAFYVHQIYATQPGRYPVKINIFSSAFNMTAPRYPDIPHTNNVPYIDAVALFNENKTLLSIIVTNYDLKNSINLTIKLHGFKINVDKDVKVVQLTAKSYTAKNSWQNPDNVRPIEYSLKPTYTDMLQFALPPLSITLLIISGTPTPITITTTVVKTVTVTSTISVPIIQTTTRTETTMYTTITPIIVSTTVTEINWPITIGVGITLLIVGFVIGYFMRRR